MFTNLTVSSKYERRFAPSPNDVNILLLGQTGVGKTTFINAFANYLIYNTLDDAIQGELHAPIAASFAQLHPETFEERIIMIGTADNDEKSDVGESCTRICRSFTFKINGRKLRLIDTPGVGDTRGVLEDEKNFADILAYISQFEHLNGICILFRPNETRLNILFRFCIKELLRHVHINAKDNLMFVFTYARSTSFQPGDSLRLLRKTIDTIQSELNIIIPFTRNNTFFLDNESFRFLALMKNQIHAATNEIEDYKRSWDYSMKEFNRLVAYIIKCKKHNIHDTVSLNQAQQLIRKLSRPIGEITTLIQANMQLAKHYRDSISSNNTKTLQQVPQMDAKIIELDFPRTVCTNKRCTKMTVVNGVYNVDYACHCHPHCYLSGVEQDYIGHEKLRECAVMDQSLDKCRKCGCDRKEHMHITYELQKFMNYINVNNSNNGENTKSPIDEFIEKLEREKKIIINVCSQIAYFLQMNSLSPINDDVLEYIEHFIREEKQKQAAGATNGNTIIELEYLKKNYQEEIEFFKEAMKLNSSVSPDSNNIINPETIFTLVQRLYDLPINGHKIKSQVKHLGHVQEIVRQNRERNVNLSGNVGYSTLMSNLQKELC